MEDHTIVADERKKANMWLGKEKCYGLWPPAFSRSSSFGIKVKTIFHKVGFIKPVYYVLYLTDFHGWNCRVESQS